MRDDRSRYTVRVPWALIGILALIAAWFAPQLVALRMNRRLTTRQSAALQAALAPALWVYVALINGFVSGGRWLFVLGFAAVVFVSFYWLGVRVRTLGDG